jgi:hypothetical protein
MAFLFSNNTMKILHFLSLSGGKTLQRMNADPLSAAIACLCTCLTLTAPAHLRAEGTPISRESSKNLSPQDELARRASWSQPSEMENTKRLEKWLSDQTETDQKRANLATTTPRNGVDTLDYLMRIICAVEKQHQGLLNDLSSMPPIEIIRLEEKLTQTENDTFTTETIRLWTARKLIRLGRYDEAALLLENLPLDSSVDPTTLLFCKAACEYWLLRIEEAAQSVAKLLEREKELPVRYRQLALLLETDITSLKEDSLDHISRRMRDVTRRLELGHAGPGVQAVQSGVIDSLDKLIKKLEEQKKQQASGGAGSSGGSMSDGRPMEDSQLAGGKGRGEVKKRELGETDEWGDLPPREREDALQQIGRDYPAHYREAIEQYFKRLATGKP